MTIMSLKAKVKKIFGNKGTLAESLPGFLPRPVQLEMALSITDALENGEVLIAEAGTGTGKTYAYLIPSILSGKKVIVSTGTKNLQDQLFHRDIPLLRKVLAQPFKTAILKGRANYICLHRMNAQLQVNNNFELTKSLLVVKNWADYSSDGEIEHLPLKPDAATLHHITSSTDNCLGQECDFFAKCFVFKARKQAQESDLIIINHHLFFADSQLKETGVSEFLPENAAVIFDEAHQLPEIATHFLGESLSSRQIIYLARDIQTEAQIDAPDMIVLNQLSDKLIVATRQLTFAFGATTRGAWEHIVNKPQIKQAIKELQELIVELVKILETVSIRGKGLENCWRRMADLFLRFTRLTAEFPENQVHWFEVQEGGFSIHHTPMYIGDFFQKVITEHAKAWIFTSATLSVNGDFSHFEFYLGLHNARKLHLQSPFNYQKQALMYIPQLQTAPNDEFYNQKILEFAVPLLKLTQGRTFFLFTSHRALKEAALLLRERVDYPLLVQGEAPKTQLLERFCALEDAILLGTSSFWEGVDIKGNHLCCVIIDKIPFMVPDDPVLKSRIDFYRRQGKNPFLEYQLPHAVIAMRQGVGRLIRDINDRGVLMLCDPRLYSKDYGKTVLDSLPPIPITQSLEDIADFLERQPA